MPLVRGCWSRVIVHQASTKAILSSRPSSIRWIPKVGSRAKRIIRPMGCDPVDRLEDRLLGGNLAQMYAARRAWRGQSRGLLSMMEICEFQCWCGRLLERHQNAFGGDGAALMREPSSMHVSTVGPDLAKNVF